MLINDASITGSLIVNASASFQNISVGGNIIPDETNLRNLGSTDKFFKEIYVSTGSINFVDNGSVVAILSAGTIAALQVTTQSANSRLVSIESVSASLQAFTASVSATNTFTSSTTTRLNSIETISASNIARLNALETTSASVDTLNTNQNNRLGSLETISASNVSRISALETTSASVDTLNTTQNSRLGSLETISASNITRISSLETTSASVDTLNTTQNTRLTNLEIKTGSLATTGSNTFIGTQTITGSLYISSDLVVQGSSSLQNITASAVSIGTNIVNLNTANPAIRYAGLSIGDSGSVGSSGSFLYDSVQDEMIFIHRGANSTVTSSVVLMGPQTFDNIGSETYPTNNRVQKGTGNEHLVDSNISDDGSKVTITGGLDITGAVSASTFTGLGNLTTYSSSVASRLLTFATTGSNTFVNTQNISLTTSGQATGLKLTNLNGGGGDAISIDFSVSGGGTTMSRLASNRTTVGSDLDVGLLLSTYSGSLTEKMRIQGNGFVGIGTTSPTQLVHVFGGGSAKGLVVETNTAHAAYVETLAGGVTRARLQSNNSAGFVGMLTNHPFSIYANNGEAMYLTSGSVGIGTNNPLYNLHIKSASDPTELVVENTAAGGTSRMRLINATRSFTLTNNATDGLLSFNYGGSNRLQFNTTNQWFNSGNVGISSESPVYKLDVVAASNSGVRIKQFAQLQDAVGAANFYNGLTFENSSTAHAFSMGYSQQGYFSINYFDNTSTYNRMISIGPTGNTGIGTTTISAKLHVFSGSPGSVTSAPSGTDVLIDATGNSYLTFRQTADSGLYSGLQFVDNNIGAYIVFRNYTVSGTSVGSDSLVYGTYCDHIFQTGTTQTTNGRTEIVRFTSTGKVGINSSTPDGFLDVVGPNNAGEVITAKFLNTGQNTVRLYQYGSSNALDNWNFWDAAGSEQHFGFRISADNSKVLGLYSDGSVGIGTTIPRRKVDIRGGNLGLLFESSEAGNASWTRSTGYYGTCTGGWGKYIEMGEGLKWFDTTSVFSDRMGTVYGWNSDYLLVGLKYGGSQDRADAWFQIEQNQEAFVFAYADTNVSCINTTNGNIYTLGGFCPNSAISDRRLKRNVETYETSMLDKMKQLRIVNFKFNEDVTQESDELQIGFIAQEVEEILPELVIERNIANSTDIWKGFKYDKLAIYNTKAIQEIAQCIDKLESCIVKLENA